MRAMFDLHNFRQKHATLQDMPMELVELHSGVPYPLGRSRVLLVAMVSSVLPHFGHTLYTRRNQQASRISCRALAARTQVAYIVLNVAVLALSPRQIFDSHFVFGVAWINIMDEIGLLVKR